MRPAPPRSFPPRPLPLLISIFLGIVTLAGAANAAPRPRLLFDESELPAIRARLDGPLRQIRDALEVGVHFPYVGNFPRTPDRGYEYFNDRRAIADSLFAFAFGAVTLDPASPYGAEAAQLAKSYLTGICAYPDWVFPETQDGPDPDLNSGHFLFAVSLAYDWLYDSLSESERQRCRDRVEIEGRKVYDAIQRNVWWLPEHLQNHNWINTSSLGMAALAFEGELRSSTEPWLDAAVENLEKVRYVIDLIEGGGWHEGTGYLHYGLDSLIPFSHAYSRLRRGQDFADTAIVRDYPALRRFMMPPSREHRREYVLWGDFSGYENDNTLLPLFYAGRKYRDGYAMWYAQRFIDGATAGRSGFTTWPPGQRGLLLSALFYDETVKPVAPPHRGAAWELDYHSRDLALWTSRSGWEDGGAMLAFKTGVFGGHGNWSRLRENGWPGGFINFGHDHADDMGIYFFADGEWLTTRVPGYWIGRNNGAPQANRTVYANSLLVDGQGQLGEGIRDCWMGSCTWFWDRQSSINLEGSTANYSFVLGAGSQLYPRPLGLEAFGRSVLFVDRKIPVVRDVVRSSAPRRFEVVWHAMDGARRDGDWLRLDAKNGRALGVRVVAPTNFEVRTEAQTAVHLNKFDPDGSMTAALVRPRDNVSEAVFLSALVPQRVESWASGRPLISALDPADPGRGLRISGLEAEETIDVIFNEAPTESHEAAGLSLQGMAGVRKTKGERDVGLMIAVGSSLTVDGIQRIEVLEGGPATVELDFEGDDTLRISGDERRLRIHAPEVKRVSFNGEGIPFDREGEYLVVPSAPGGGDGENPGGGGTGGGGSGGDSGGGPAEGGSGGGGGEGGAGGNATGGSGGAGCSGSSGSGGSGGSGQSGGLGGSGGMGQSGGLGGSGGSGFTGGLGGSGGRGPDGAEDPSAPVPSKGVAAKRFLGCSAAGIGQSSPYLLSIALLFALSRRRKRVSATDTAPPQLSLRSARPEPR